MTPLFSKEGLAQLAQVAQPGMLCVFDFDGTLAPIVARPGDARLPDGVHERLQALQRRTPVAILTGRAVADIGARLKQFTPDYLIGNHGLEGLPDSPLRRDGFAQLCRRWREQLEQTFAQALPGSSLDAHGIELEDKQISLSVHYRHATDQAGAERDLRSLFDTLSPAPRVIGGKCVFNLLPQAAGDKGTAFVELMQLSQAPSALYVGDDVTDEDVFRLARPELLSIRVGERAGSAATCYLRQYADIARLLDQLIAMLTPA